MSQHLPDPTLDAQFYDGVVFKRALAWVIDVLIVAGLVLVALIASLGILAVILPVLIFALNVAYRIWAIHRWSATLGMRAVGIELRNMSGDRFDLAQATGHTLIYVFAVMSLIGGLANIVMMLVTARGQGLSDLVLGSVAINTPADKV